MGPVPCDQQTQLIDAIAAIGMAQISLQTAMDLVAALLEETVMPEPTPIPYWEAINAAAQGTGMDPLVLAGLIKAESNFDSGAKGSAGEVGLCQIMPPAWSDVMDEPYSQASEPWLNIWAGASYWMRQHGYMNLSRHKPDDWDDSHLWWAFVAYNAGPGQAMRWLEEGKALGDLPAQVQRNLGNYRAGLAWAHGQHE